MGKTLFDLTYELAKYLGVLKEGTATGGSTSTIVDTVERTEADDYWNGGTAWITYDAGGAGAAPQGEYSYISDFTATNDTVSLRTTLTAAVASGDRYAIAKRRYPLHILIQMVNQNLGIIEKTDITSLDTALEQTEYTLPSDVLTLKQVYVGVGDDSNANEWGRVDNWSVQKAATGTANTLIIPQYEADYPIKLVYLTYHAALRAATDKLDDSINIKKVVANAAVDCLLWRKASVGESDASLNELLNYYQAKANQVNSEFAQHLPHKHARTIKLGL